MYYLNSYQKEEHVSINSFNKLASLITEAKGYKWADAFEVFADHWETYKISGKVKSDGDIVWKGSHGEKCLNEWIEI